MSAPPDFLDLIRGFERGSPGQPRVGASGSRGQDIVHLGQEPYVDFSDSNVGELEQTPDGKPLVFSRFLGLLGPQGALPLHTTYETRHWLNMRDRAFARFADLFNNRFLQLFYRTWANARPAVQADRPADNQFITYIGAAIGIATPPTQNRDSVPDFTKLALAGLMAPAVKSAARLENILAWMFKVRVAVEQFVGMWLPLEPDEQAVLSKGNCCLGVDSLIGQSAFSLRDKFRIKLRVASLGEFESFLPDGKNYRILADAVEFYVGQAFIYDVALGLEESHVKPVQLGAFGRLGWTSWVSVNEAKTSNVARWDCHFYPAETK